MSTHHGNHKPGSASLRYALLSCALLTPMTLPALKNAQPVKKSINTNANDARDVCFEAAKRGDLYTLKVISLTTGIFKGVDDSGKTLLHHAVYKSGDVLDYLINAGIDLNKKDNQGDTALMLALKYENLAAAQLLINKNARVDTVDADGNTALHIALKNDKLKIFASIIPALVKKGAPVNAHNVSGITPLMVLAGGQQTKHAISRVSRFIQLLIDNGAQVNATDKDGDTALCFALSRYHAVGEVTDLLLQNGAQVNMADKKGTTPLMKAPYFEVFSTLLNKGAHVNVRNFEGVTPLMIAVSVLHEEDAVARTRALLARKVAINAQDKEGLTALHYALNHGKNTAALELIRAGASVTLRDKLGRTALHKTSCHYEENQLPLAAMLKKGADINAKDKQGNTPMHYLVKQEYFAPELIKLFSRHGADLSVRNNAGKTPLNIAAAYRRYVEGYDTDTPGEWITGEEAVKTLKECGAKA